MLYQISIKLIINQKRYNMETTETKASKLGLEKGYYLLLMAILEAPEEA